LKKLKIKRVDLTNGLCWVKIPEAGFFLMCGCPADAVKHFMKRGLIQEVQSSDNVSFETGPNAILLSDIVLQNGSFSNLAEFPVMQMMYRQGMIIPGHPGNNGERPLIIGSKEQVQNQLQYIYRGNYGLISKEEIMDAGISTKLADDMMKLKLKFAFGSINHPTDLIDTTVVDEEPVFVKKGVKIERISPNVFQISYKDESICVDLNLKHKDSFEPPYSLNYHLIDREYFAIIHSGEGDGWDVNRPCMSSIIIFQGKIYLIDAGPNILYSLNSLGIGLNEVHGIFHTHSHDDHFAGLTLLMGTDHRIKYYATKLVRSCVTKKLSALLSLEEENFNQYFEPIDLEFEEWNDVNGLEVKPVFSPHPVETSTFHFRTHWNDSYKTFSHLADITSLKVLEAMVSKKKGDKGISQKMFDDAKKQYLEPQLIKKIDVGGGMIHGVAEDFKKDQSNKIILAHSPHEPTTEEMEIGSGAPFGTVDHLIISKRDYLFSYAQNFLEMYFPKAPKEQVESLLNFPVLTFNPESIILKSGTVSESVFLILTGNVKAVQSEHSSIRNLSAGALLGESNAVSESINNSTYRAHSFVKALKIPSPHYSHFIKKNGLYDDIKDLENGRRHLQKSWLFSDSITTPVLNNICKEMKSFVIEKGEINPVDLSEHIVLIKSGSIKLKINEENYQTLKAGDFFGEEMAIFKFPQCFTHFATQKCHCIKIPAKVLDQIPVVRFKLQETYEIKLTHLFHSNLVKSFLEWDDSFRNNVHTIDNHHKDLFIMICIIINAAVSKQSTPLIKLYFEMLTTLTLKHFTEEERLMQRYKYPQLNKHRQIHKKLLDDLIKLSKKKTPWVSTKSGSKFIKEWFIDHISSFDNEFGAFLNSKRVY
jgi:hemerythrin